MSQTNFMWQGGRKIEIEADPAEVAIEAPDEPAAREAARGAGVTPTSLSIAGPGLIRAVLPDRDTDMDRLRAAHHVVHHVYHAAQDPETEFLITDGFFLKFKPGTSDSAIRGYFQTERLILEQDLGDDTYLVRVTDETGKNPIRAANAAAERPDVAYAEPNLVRSLHRMFLPADPLFRHQWHLHSPADDGDLLAGAGVFAPGAWDITCGSREIVIAIADDGFDLTHPDLIGPRKIAGRINLELTGPTTLVANDQVGPRAGDYHGTPCAGVALAEHNGRGTVGVAPGCALLAVRFPLAEMSDAHFIRMFDAISTRADVVSCSWGVPPTNAPMSTALRNRLAALATRGGQRGKGLVICVAAGNNNAPVRDLENTTPYRFLDAFGRVRSYAGPIDRWIAAHPDVLAISACSSLKRRSAYSSWGREIAVCAPSNNFHDLREFPVAGRGIFTTDNEGFGDGSDFSRDSRYTSRFGGTSSATPTVAGVCGLVLSANPLLTAREVGELIKSTADKDLDMTSDTPVSVSGEFNDGFSLWFGHGKVNAQRAVAAAAAALGRGRTIKLESDTRAAIADQHTVWSEVATTEAGTIMELRIKVAISHTYIGDLRVELVAPDGTAALLHSRSGDSADTLESCYAFENTPGLKAFAGKDLKGTWRLGIRDMALFDSGELQHWELAARVAG